MFRLKQHLPEIAGKTIKKHGRYNLQTVNGDSGLRS